MRFRRAVIGCLALVSLTNCKGSDATGVYGSSGGDQSGNVGRGGGPVGAVTIGANIRFVSDHNGSQNPAVDTIRVGDTVTWTWTGPLPHGVQSLGSKSFSSSRIMTGSGTHAVTFTAPGTYQYDCAVHGTSMRGTIVVQ
jgi:plastocyanin